MKEPNKLKELHTIIRPLPEAIWAADFPFQHLESGLNQLAEDYGAINLCPDFQRGHVWTGEQRQAFCEALIRKMVPPHLLTLQFNCPHWNFDSDLSTDLPREIQCVDGLQRITTIFMLLRGEIKPFGLSIDDLDGTEFSIRRIHRGPRIAMHNFKTKRELLQYYLDINGGGTPHTKSELDRVREMMTTSTP